MIMIIILSLIWLDFCVYKFLSLLFEIIVKLDENNTAMIDIPTSFYPFIIHLKAHN